MFSTADAPIVVAVGTDAQWIACAEALGLDALARDPALATNTGRLANRAGLVTALSARLRTAPSAEWLSRLSAAAVPCGKVRNILDVVRDAGGSALTGMPPATPGLVRRPPPSLGEHTAQVRELGWRAFDQ
jgi:crotonobetainyl-CoA:carnitine CoA-transferase CaiB-like acyl-CoA transferase